MAATFCGVGGPDYEGSTELVKGCVIVHTSRAPLKGKRGTLRRGGVHQKESDMGEGVSRGRMKGDEVPSCRWTSRIR